MLKFKKITCLVLVVLLFMTLVACSDSSEGQESSGSEPSAQSEQEASGQQEGGAAEEKDKGEEITLEFWDMVWGPASYNETAKELVERFNKENDKNIKVNYQFLSWSNWYENFVTAISAGEAPDVSTGGGYSQHAFAAMGEILPLDSIIEEWEEEGILDDFFPHLIEYFKYEGKQVGIPWNVDARCIYYRKDFFEEKGLKEPKNWDEFIEVAKALTDGERYGLVFSLQDTASGHCMQYFMANNGAGFFDENGNVDVANERNIQALDFVRKFKEEGIVPETIISTTQSDAEKMFFTGKAAMVIFAVDFAEILMQEQPEEFVENVGVLPPIEGWSGDAFAALNTNAIMAYSQTEYPEEAKYFIKWWSENNLELWTKGKMGPLPARYSYYEDPFFKNNRFKAFFGNVIIPNAVPQTYPYPHAVPAMNAIEGQGFHRIIVQEAYTTDKDSKTILEEIEKQVQEIVDSYKP